MRIAEFAVRRPQFTLVAFLCLAVLGVTAFRTIPRSEDPYFPLPVYTVVAIYPGATSTQLEQEVVRELETQIATISNIKRTITRIGDSVAVIQLEFDTGIDRDAKKGELLRQVESARSKLPSGVTSIEVKQADTTNVSVLQIGLLVPTAPWQQVEPIVERLKRKFESIKGVKEVAVFGVAKTEARVDLDAVRFARSGLPLSQLLGAIAGGNASVPGADVDLGSRRFTVQTSGAFDGIHALEREPVGAGPSGSLVTVGDVATVNLAAAPSTYDFRFNGQRAALVTVAMRNGENIFDVVDHIKAEMQQAGKTLPPGMSLSIGFDQSRNVQHRLGGLQRDFLIAIALVLVTLIPLGLRASLLVMISIPMSLAIGVAMLSWLGYSLNQLSIVGFVIALGLLVDDSIVVAENIARWIRMGETRQQAAIKATRQIGVAVLGCTATLIFAFVPLLFLPGNAGAFIRCLPVAVVVTILASLLVSLTLIPFLASRFLRGEDEHGNAAFRVMSRGIERVYRPVLATVMRWPKLTLLGAALVVAGSVALVPQIGFSLFPKAGIPQFLVNIKSPDGTSLQRTGAIVEEVESIVRAEPSIKTVMSSAGEGHPQIYYNRAPEPRGANVADVYVELDEYSDASTPALLERLRAKFTTIPGAEIGIREFENGPPVQAPIEIRLIGDDLDALRRMSAVVASRLAAVSGTRDVRDPLAIRRTDIAALPDERRAALAGIPSVEVDRSVRMAIRGLPVGKLHRPALDDVEIVVGVGHVHDSSKVPDLSSLDQIEVNSMLGGSAPLDAVTELKMKSAAGAISHYNRERYVSITSEVVVGRNVAAVSTSALATMESLPLPLGMRWMAGGLVESQKESFSGLGPAIIIAIFGILAVLVLEFGSFSATLIVAAVIPLGAAGGLVALYLAGETLSFTASVGFIALTGIEVKNSLLLVDFTEQLRREGMSTDDAIRKAGEIRFFPILLTSLTAIGGLIPLVLEHSALYSPLAIVLIGGLVSSTLLSRLITPVLSKLLLRPVSAEVSPQALVHAS
jgi:multidrug efflux pump subunit AcrB